MDILSPRWCTSDLVTGMKGFYRGIRARGCRRALPRIALEGALPGELVRELTPPPPAWVTSPHHHAPSGREVDGALSRPSPKRNGAPNTCPDYCAFPGCSLSVREGSVRVVTPWNTRTPAPSPSLGSITSATTGRRPGLHRLGRETPDWHPCLSGQGGPPQGPQELRLAAFLPL